MFSQQNLGYYYSSGSAQPLTNPLPSALTDGYEQTDINKYQSALSNAQSNAKLLKPGTTLSDNNGWMSDLYVRKYYTYTKINGQDYSGHYNLKDFQEYIDGVGPNFEFVPTGDIVETEQRMEKKIPSNYTALADKTTIGADL